MAAAAGLAMVLMLAVAGSRAQTPPAAPAPAALDASLDTVIKQLDNDQARGQLVGQLKALRAATAKLPHKPAQGDAPGAMIASILPALEGLLRQTGNPAAFWKQRLEDAGDDLAALLVGDRGETPAEGALQLLLTLGVWAAVAALMTAGLHIFARRLKLDKELPPDPPVRVLVLYALRRLLPWIIAFLVTAQIASFDDHTSPGRQSGLLIAYAILCGRVLAAVVLIAFAIVRTGHRRPAAQLLLLRSRNALMAIGSCAALGDALHNPAQFDILGGALAATLSTLANLVAAALASLYVLRFRRPIAHLIRNRSYPKRSAGRLTTDSLQMIASLWHVPILLLIALASAVTLFAPARSETALRSALATASLIALATVVAILLRRFLRPRATAAGRRSPMAAPYIGRLLGFAAVAAILAVIVALVELVSRVWGFSLYQLAHATPLGEKISASLSAIGTTVLFAWFVWILIDTALQEAINPSARHGRLVAPGGRARTILPLLRNAAAITITVVALIVSLANIGVNVTPLIAGAGVVGLAVGFGAQTLVQDIITGLFILIEDTISIGDTVDVSGGHAGTVEGLTIRTVRLRDGDGALHTVPFSQIKAVKNQSRDFGYALFTVRVTFDSDVDEAMRLMGETGAALYADPGLRSDVLAPLELFGLDHFEGVAVVIMGGIRTKPLAQYGISRAFNKLLKEKFDGSAGRVRFAGSVPVWLSALPPPDEVKPAPA